MSLFPSLPDQAQVWLFAADRSLSEAEIEQLHATIDPFVASWKSHGRPVAAGFQVVAGRVLVLAGYLSGDHVSGCGVDAATDVLTEAAATLGIRWHTSLDVLYRDGDEIVATSRAGFKKLISTGDIDAETRVFDFTVGSLGALRADGLEKPAGRTWLRRYFATETIG